MAVAKHKERSVIMDRKFADDFPDTGVGDAPDLFGLEVELEGMKIKTQRQEILKWWGSHVDNSLRIVKPDAQTNEYVFLKPLNMDDTKIALKALFDYLNTNPGTEVFPSYRTSIHVHVNCLQESYRTIFNFITLAFIFDELFVSQNGETRIGNNFALRTKDAEGQIMDLITSIKMYGTLGGIQMNHRYSSINIASLMKFGTIEFRSLECTTDYNRVIAWINVIQGLKLAARQYENPRDIIAKFSRRGPLGFMLSHLGDQYPKYGLIPNAQVMLRDGMRLAQDLAYCSDWKPGDTDVKVIKGAKKVNLDPFEQAVLNAHDNWPQPLPVPPVQGWGLPPQPHHALIVDEDDPVDFDD